MYNQKTLLDYFLEDNTLLDGINLPSGMDLAVLKNLIIDQSGSLYPYYQSSQRLKKSITNWSLYRLDDWTRAWAAMTIDYNPVHNYYREELGSEEIEHHHGTKTSLNRREIETPDINVVNDQTDTPGISTTSTGSVSAYDASEFAPTGKNIVASSGSSNLHTVNHETGSKTLMAESSENYTVVSDIDANTFDRDAHTFIGRITQGNIGVTRSQDMIKDELTLRFDYSVYEMLAQEFEKKFLIQLY